MNWFKLILKFILSACVWRTRCSLSVYKMRFNVHHRIPLCTHSRERRETENNARDEKKVWVNNCTLFVVYFIRIFWFLLFSYTFKNKNSRLMIFSNSLGKSRIETTFCECLLYIFTYILPLYNQLMFFFVSVSLLNIARILLIL